MYVIMYICCTINWPGG